MDIKVLVANGSEKERKNITRSLKEIGVTDIVEANDGKKATECLKKDKFDVVFVEYNTQSKETEELVKAARKTDSKTPVIVTAPQSQKIEEVKKACPNATKYMTTPFTTEQLRKTVGEYAPSFAG